MPELRSGPRQGRLKSRRLADISTPVQPLEEAQDLIIAKRSGRNVCRGKGNAAALEKGNSRGRGRGRADRNLDPNLEACKIQIQVPVEKVVVMEGASGEKVGAEEEATTSPIPDRVSLS